MSKKGFTLIELLVVIAIIGILAVLIIVALGRARASARNSARKSVLNSIAQAEEMYQDANQAYAPDLGTLQTAGFLTNPNANGGNPGGTQYQIFTGAGTYCTNVQTTGSSGDPKPGMHCSQNGCASSGDTGDGCTS